MTRRPGRAIGASVAALLPLLAACSGEPSPEVDPFVPGRHGPFGSLRDFAVVQRVGDRPADVLLVDRFEATQADWRQFAQSPAGEAVAAADVVLRPGPSLPVAGITLRQAAAFAHWRLGRLPSAEEWRVVTVGDARGEDRFPWGQRRDPTRANTGELAMGEATPVGTFESGRRASGDAPYDLIGNVREWTSSVPPGWFQDRGGLDVGRGTFVRSRNVASRLAAATTWALPRGVLPAGILVGVGGDGVPRITIGGDFESAMDEAFGGQQIASERRQRTGLRVYTTVGELLQRLLAVRDAVDAGMMRQVELFVARDGHGALLQAALGELPAAQRGVAPGSLGAALLAWLQDGAVR